MTNMPDVPDQTIRVVIICVVVIAVFIIIAAVVIATVVFLCWYFAKRHRSKTEGYEREDSIDGKEEVREEPKNEKTTPL